MYHSGDGLTFSHSTMEMRDNPTEHEISDFYCNPSMKLRR